MQMVYNRYVYVFLSGRRAHYVGQYNCIIAAAAADNMCVSILANVCKLVYRRCQDCQRRAVLMRTVENI